MTKLLPSIKILWESKPSYFIERKSSSQLDKYGAGRSVEIDLYMYFSIEKVGKQL